MDIPVKDIQVRQYGSLLARYLRPQWIRVVVLGVLLLLTIGLQLANPQIVRYFIDSATTGAAIETLIWAAVAFLGIALLTQLVTVAATYVGENVGWTATNNLRGDLAMHILRLDMPFHKTHTPGELIERIDGDVTALSKFFSQFVIHVLGNILLMFGVLIVLFIEDWRLGASLGVFVLVTMFALNKMRGMAIPAMTAERQASAEQFGFVEERLAGLDDVRANGAGAHAMRGMYKVMHKQYWAARKAWEVEGRMWGITISLFTIGTVTALGVGAYLFQAGALTLGTLYLLYSYSQLLRQPLEALTDQLRELQRAGAGIGRVQQLYATSVDILDGPGVRFPEGPLSVEFDGVSFGYGDEEMVLKDITFRLQPGKVLGLLGRTGSGKTTITRLLFRLYDPASGTILLGGQPIADATLDNLRGHIGMVTQDVQLFDTSLRDNLTLFDPDVPDDRVLAVLDDLGMSEWYRSLPEGLDTQLGPGGGGVSAGQAQLLAFARVFLKDPGLVILDEASSRLDPATEQLIERAVDKLLRGRTGIIIAHRLPTVQRADEIMILDNGEVLEHGPRAVLAVNPASRFYALLRTGLEELLA
jgi:ABC-type multidrug transport system fused ATPase/permease subunit